MGQETAPDRTDYNNARPPLLLPHRERSLLAVLSSCPTRRVSAPSGHLTCFRVVDGGSPLFVVTRAGRAPAVAPVQCCSCLLAGVLAVPGSEPDWESSEAQSSESLPPPSVLPPFPPRQSVVTLGEPGPSRRVRQLSHPPPHPRPPPPRPPLRASRCIQLLPAAPVEISYTRAHCCPVLLYIECDSTLRGAHVGLADTW